VLGVVSDAQQSWRQAVAEVFPGVPHPRCQYHALREAMEPWWEADRHLLAHMQKALRALARGGRSDAPTPGAARGRRRSA